MRNVLKIVQFHDKLWLGGALQKVTMKKYTERGSKYCSQKYRIHLNTKQTVVHNSFGLVSGSPVRSRISNNIRNPDLLCGFLSSFKIRTILKFKCPVFRNFGFRNLDFLYRFQMSFDDQTCFNHLNIKVQTNNKIKGLTRSLLMG